MSTRNVIFLVLLTMISACDEQKVKVFNGKKIDRHELEEFISSRMDSLQIAGLSIALFNNDKITYQGAFGVKNLTSQEQVDEETLFEAASLSKPLFSHFVMKQVEKGILDLDMPLFKYYAHPDISNTEWGQLITARMVLTHTTGFPNWREDYRGPLEIRFKPGTQYGYSGEGYQYLKNVLCHILQINQRELDKVFQEDVAKVIDAKNMSFIWHESFEALKTFGHQEGKPTDNHSQGPTFLFGAAGGLHTNSTDYAKFLIHVLNTEIEKSKLFEIQTKLPHAKGELHRSLGFPVRIVNDKVRYWHAGSNRDYRTYFQFYEDEKMGVVMLSNSDAFFRSGCAKEILEYLGDEWVFVN